MATFTLNVTSTVLLLRVYKWMKWNSIERIENNENKYLFSLIFERKWMEWKVILFGRIEWERIIL